MDTNSHKPTGQRKFKGYAYTTLAALAVFGGALLYCWASQTTVGDVMPLVTATFFSIGSTFGIFAGTNSVVHATTKDAAA